MECHEFEISIGRDGKVTVHIKGVKGAGCLDYAKVFQEILGGTGQVNVTHEYYEPPTGVEIRIKHETERAK